MDDVGQGEGYAPTKIRGQPRHWVAPQLRNGPGYRFNRWEERGSGFWNRVRFFYSLGRTPAGEEVPKNGEINEEAGGQPDDFAPRHGRGGIYPAFPRVVALQRPARTGNP